MGSWHSYSSLSGAALVAAAAGVLLGNSAIDQINPLYFQGAAEHPRDRGAEVDAAPAPTGPRFADHYGWEEGQAARSADCHGCAAVAARDAYASGTQFAVIESGLRGDPQPVSYHYAEPAAGPENVPEQAAPAAEPTELERYASFQVEEKPAATEPVEVAAAPATE